MKKIVKNVKNVKKPISGILQDVKQSGKIIIQGSNDYPPNVKKILSQYGNEIIKGMSLKRTPVSGALTDALSLFSAGKFGRRLDKSFDEVFHLFLELQLQSGTRLLIEKNERINMEINPRERPDTQIKNVVNIPQNLSINQLLETTKRQMGNQYFQYDAVKNNCQNFILEVLKSNGIGDEQDYAFIKQDTEQLFKGLPALKKVAHFATELGERGNIVSQGGTLGRGNASSRIRPETFTSRVAPYNDDDDGNLPDAEIIETPIDQRIPNAIATVAENARPFVNIRTFNILPNQFDGYIMYLNNPNLDNRTTHMNATYFSLLTRFMGNGVGISPEEYVLLMNDYNDFVNGSNQVRNGELLENNIQARTTEAQEHSDIMQRLYEIMNPVRTATNVPVRTATNVPVRNAMDAELNELFRRDNDSDDSENDGDGVFNFENSVPDAPSSGSGLIRHTKNPFENKKFVETIKRLRRNGLLPPSQVQSSTFDENNLTIEKAKKILKDYDTNKAYYFKNKEEMLKQNKRFIRETNKRYREKVKMKKMKYLEELNS